MMLTLSWCKIHQQFSLLPMMLAGYRHEKTPKFIIDWHNLGYSMLHDRSVVQRVAKWYEEVMAPMSDGHLCLTKAAMKTFLQIKLKVKTEISVLYDCPPRYAFLMRPLQQEDTSPRACKWTRDLTELQTLLTKNVRNLSIGLAMRSEPMLRTTTQFLTYEATPRRFNKQISMKVKPLPSSNLFISAVPLSLSIYWSSSWMKIVQKCDVQFKL